MLRHTAAHHRKLDELVEAVFEGGDASLQPETLVIRMGRGRQAKTMSVEGIHFGKGPYSGYLVSMPDGHRIATDHYRLWWRTGLQQLEDFDTYLRWLVDDVHPDDVSATVDKVLYAIERLLPDGHPMKREKAPNLSYLKVSQ